VSSSKPRSKQRSNTSTSLKRHDIKAVSDITEIEDTPPSPKDKMPVESDDTTTANDASMDEEKTDDEVSVDTETPTVPSEGSSEDDFKVLSVAEFGEKSLKDSDSDSPTASRQISQKILKDSYSPDSDSDSPTPTPTAPATAPATALSSAPPTSVDE